MPSLSKRSQLSPDRRRSGLARSTAAITNPSGGTSSTRADAAALCRRTNRIGGGAGATYQSTSRGALRFQGAGTGGACCPARFAGAGRRRSTSDEDRAWGVDLASQKPKDLGYAQELWTTRLLAQHIRSHCVAAGPPQLQKLGPGAVPKSGRLIPGSPAKSPITWNGAIPSYKPRGQKCCTFIETSSCGAGVDGPRRRWVCSQLSTNA
jgi:hypothetical protein